MNLYDGITTRLIEDGLEDADPSEVEKTLAHRQFPDDYFYNAWDHAISNGARLYREVHNIPEPEETP